MFFLTSLSAGVLQLHSIAHNFIDINIIASNFFNSNIAMINVYCSLGMLLVLSDHTNAGQVGFTVLLEICRQGEPLT